MTTMHRVVLIALLFPVLGSAACRDAETSTSAAPRALTPSNVEATQRVSSTPSAEGREAGDLAWVAVGGGVNPESNQLAIERDLALVVETLSASGKLLYAAGPETAAVQVRDDTPRGTELMTQLAAIFAPRGGRDAHYRKTVLEPAGAATRERVMEAFGAALRGSPGPLLLWISAHGEPGATAAENVVSLWGGGVVTPIDLAELLDAEQGERQVRTVITACYSGGFAELVFTGAMEAAGATSADRCGFFATTWDLESSGCGADRDRRLHEGYGMYFLWALRGRDRDGNALPRERLDLDGDGRISLLEAHSQVRIASRGIDVPTTTSERWLRHTQAPTPGPTKPVDLPEEEAVIAALSERLDVRDPAQVGERFLAFEAQLEANLATQERASQEELAAYDALAAEMLARWPVVDDPWHPDFGPTLEEHGDAIAAYLETSPRHGAYEDAMRRVDEAVRERDRLLAEKAPWERLLRAMETRELAAELHARGGADWEVYQRLLACERGAAPLSDEARSVR